MSRNMHRRKFVKTLIGSTAFGVVASRAFVAEEPRPNIMLITVDDMNWDSTGCTGSKVPEITPHIDRLASEGRRFVHAHVTAAICQPCRQSLMTGRYPHSNGAPGFNPIDRKVPTLQEQLRAAGYVNGILGKVIHLAPADKFPWDMSIDAGGLGGGRDPKLYYQNALAFIRQAKAAGKPFFLMFNSHDPHRPFAGSTPGAQEGVSRVYKPEEVEVPGFLPDIPDVRKEVAQYFTSVHRADETVGAGLRALEDAETVDNTLVMFLSDNGMAFPFAKTNCYLASTRTPWIVRWPGKVKAGEVDAVHFICGIDYMPTILDIVGLPQVEGMEGSSFLPVLLGGRQEQRDHVVTEINTISSGASYPMRCVQDRTFGYIFNAWSDGKTVFKNESQSGLTFKAMQAAAQTDAGIAERVRLFQYRVAEELYDFSQDPNALRNLVAEPGLQGQVSRLRKMLEEHMMTTADPVLKKFEAFLSSQTSGR